MRRWDDEDMNYLLKLVSENAGMGQMVDVLKRTPAAILKKAKDSKIRLPFIGQSAVNDYYSGEEDELIRSGIDIDELVEKTGRTRVSLWRRGKILGVDLVEKRRWTDDEQKWLLENHRNKSFEDMAKYLNRTVRSVRHRVYESGLRETIGAKKWL
jgi:hypothetical protein